MGKGKKLIILILVVLLLGGAYFAVTHFLSDDSDPQTEPDESVSVVDLNADDISKISYVYGEENISLVKDGETWYLESDKSFPLNQSLASEMASEVSSLAASRLISETSDDFSEYGLSEPSMAFDFTLSDGSGVTYFIGNFNSFSDSYYLNVYGEEKIYLISSSFIELFQKGQSDLAEVTALTTVSTEDVSSVNMILDGKRMVVFNVPDGLDTVYTDSYTWFSDSTTPIDTDAAKKLVGLAVAFTESGCADYSADEAELSSYGFDEPLLTLTVDYTVTDEKETGEMDENDLPITETITTDKVLNLMVGGQSNDGRYYAKEAKSDIVYLIDTEYIENLRSFDTSSLRYSDVCLIETDEIESMTVTVDKETHTIDISRSADDDGNLVVDYTLDGELMTATDFYSVYSSIQSIVSEGITDKTLDYKDAYITVMYKLNREGFSEMTLKFVPFDRSFYVVDFNGRCDILVNKRDVEEIADIINGLKG